jgi:hypothetical protein
MPQRGYYSFSAMSDTRIRRISISHFRGVPQELTLDFVMPGSASPQSLILYGENGLGKSTVVDALEFALQGRVRRSRDLVSRAGPYTLSLANQSGPRVQVELSDGSEVGRRMELQQDGSWSITDKTPHHAFNHGPFVLRRSDILQFLSTPESRRQFVFADFRVGLGREAKVQGEEFEDLPNQTIAQAEEQLFAAKNKLRRYAILLGARLECDPSEIPIEENDFNKLIVNRLYDGLSSEEARTRGIERGRLDPDIKQILWHYRDSMRVVSETGSLIRALKRRGTSKPPNELRLRGVRKTLDDIGDRIGEHFAEVSSSKFIRRVVLDSGDSTLALLKIDLELANGAMCTPQQVLSEANLDLLALLIFLAFAQESAAQGQAKLLVLDDVFQSIDASIRLSLAELILREFSSWQLLFTVHDRLWHEQLLHLFRQKGRTVLDREIVHWTFDRGPTIREATVDPDVRLLEALNSSDAALICSSAGLLLEEICDRLSWTLPITVQRKRGDKYTLGDLWPGTLKVLRKTSLSNIAEAVDRLVHLRNLVGAHYNEWARSVSLDEARSFGEAVVELFWAVRCDTCFRWLEATTDRSWQCRCGQVKLETAKLQ